MSNFPSNHWRFITLPVFFTSSSSFSFIRCLLSGGPNDLSGFYNGRRCVSKRKSFSVGAFFISPTQMFDITRDYWPIWCISLLSTVDRYFIPKHGPSNPDVLLPALSLAAIFSIHGITLNRPSRNDVVLPAAAAAAFSNSLVECRSDYCVVVECWCPARNNPARLHHPPWKCKTLMYFIFTIGTMHNNKR